MRQYPTCCISCHPLFDTTPPSIRRSTRTSSPQGTVHARSNPQATSIPCHTRPKRCRLRTSRTIQIPTPRSSRTAPKDCIVHAQSRSRAGHTPPCKSPRTCPRCTARRQCRSRCHTPPRRTMPQQSWRNTRTSRTLCTARVESTRCLRTVRVEGLSFILHRSPLRLPPSSHLHKHIPPALSWPSHPPQPELAQQQNTEDESTWAQKATRLVAAGAKSALGARSAPDTRKGGVLAPKRHLTRGPRVALIALARAIGLASAVRRAPAPPALKQRAPCVTRARKGILGADFARR